MPEYKVVGSAKIGTNYICHRVRAQRLEPSTKEQELGKEGQGSG